MPAICLYEFLTVIVALDYHATIKAFVHICYPKYSEDPARIAVKPWQRSQCHSKKEHRIQLTTCARIFL